MPEALWFLFWLLQHSERRASTPAPTGASAAVLSPATALLGAWVLVQHVHIGRLAV